MCSVYNTGPGKKTYAADWEKHISKQLDSLIKPYAIRRTDNAPVLLKSGSGSFDLITMRWGFHREFNPAINNARADKLAGKMWEESFQERRCLIPLTSYYEWKGGQDKQTYAFMRPDKSAMWVAGLWEKHANMGNCFSMITTNAASSIAHIHDRMPAILASDTAVAYINGECRAEELQENHGEIKYFACANPLKMNNPAEPEAMPEQEELF